jgi:TIR domain/AAA-like domain
MTQQREIFISYSSQDKSTAETIRESLENAALSCWIAPRDIIPGRKYAEAILDGIDQCKVFVLVLTESANASPQVEMEVNHAASVNKFILSFRLDQSKLSKSLEYYLGNRHWLEVANPPREQDYEALISAVRRLLSANEDEPELPPKDKDEDIMPATLRVPEGKKRTLPVSSNPFTFGNPIKEPEHFHGRKAEIRQILNRLLSSAHESTSIIGERRIGKTSLLIYLSNPETAEALGLTPDRFCLTYVDFQGLTDITPQRFWQRVLGKMARSICDDSLKPVIESVIKQNKFDLFDLEDIFEKSQDRGLTVVLLMDEFEYVTQNPNFKSDFFGGLRALAIHHGVALIPATRRELADLCHSDEIKGSPFFNIFANVVLRPFSRSEVAEVLDGYSAESGQSFDQIERNFIWSLGGGYPLFVQMAGYYLVEGRLQNLARNDLAQFVSDNFNQQADSHYAYIWGHSSDSEKITLLTLLTISLQPESPKNATTLENLTRLRVRIPQDLAVLGKRGLVIEMDGRYRIFSTTFENWIRQEILSAPGAEESQTTVEDWLKSGGRQNLKETQKMLPGIKKKYWPLMAELVKDFSLEFAAVGTIEILRAFIH